MPTVAVETGGETGRGSKSVNPWSVGASWQEAQPYVAFLDGPPHDPQVWYDDFLTHLATHGSAVLASMHARTGRATIYRYRDSDPVFAAEMELARLYYLDRLEWELVHTSRVTGNPLGYFGRLKAERPERYIERNMTVTMNVHAELSSQDALPILREMLASVTPTTQAQLGQGVIEATAEPVSEGEDG